jgi:hypothetical protein
VAVYREAGAPPRCRRSSDGRTGAGKGRWASVVAEGVRWIKAC